MLKGRFQALFVGFYVKLGLAETPRKFRLGGCLVRQVEIRDTQQRDCTQDSEPLKTEGCFTSFDMASPCDG